MSIKKKSYNEYMSKRGSYALVPNEIWERSDLDHKAKVIWCYLVSRDPKWKSSRNNIARNLGMGVNTVSGSITQLISLNLIKVQNGASGAWNFEIVSPNEWISDEAGSDEHRIQKRSNAESAVDPLLDPFRIHTQEAIINTLADKLICSQEAKDTAPEEAEGDQRIAVILQNPGNNNITSKNVLISWRNQYPQGPGFLSGKKASSALNDLFFNLKKHGFSAEDVTSNQIIRLAFGPNPKINLKSWIEDIEVQIDLQRSAIFEQKVEIETASMFEDFSQLISPEAISKYKQYKAEGKTPADFNGMSLIDYANMRAYAESFKAIG